ncbi:hypothetical protein D8B26_001827 [Coccidioides posadasii str. Silveira]|uniref:uncharacterized protein n=1 Tax=Coccidioides posadasii (strain RMSCC 757 / Silveira) TaxID=443226 RepID=UPI001BEFAA58|nr:hypothetical protein D8B26_001827 [Coccidioides posadasii str. Silveira]
MNKMVWLPDKDRYTAKPRYQGGLLTATIVTFTHGKVRIVQASIKPSEKHPTLNLILRAIYTLNNANYDKKVAFDVLKWILDPPQAEPETEFKSTETAKKLPESEEIRMGIRAWDCLFGYDSLISARSNGSLYHGSLVCQYLPERIKHVSHNFFEPFTKEL